MKHSKGYISLHLIQEKKKKKKKHSKWFCNETFLKLLCFIVSFSVFAITFIQKFRYFADFAETKNFLAVTQITQRQTA